MLDQIPEARPAPQMARSRMVLEVAGNTLAGSMWLASLLLGPWLAGSWLGLS